MTAWVSPGGRGTVPLRDLPLKPLVSIVIPSFNQGQYIERTLDSIFAQKYRPLEVIVIDGNSRDDTQKILAKFEKLHPELSWISEPDDGPADAVNKGLSLARGNIIGIQSSDDMYYADALECAVENFQRYRHVGMIYGESDTIDPNDHVIDHYAPPEFSWPAMFAISFCLPQQSIFFRQELYQALGGWNGKYFGCDLDYWLRLALRTPVLKVGTTFSAWRSYPTQRTQGPQFAKIWQGYWSMVRDNTDLALANRNIRKMARASRHLLALRYHPTGALWPVRWHLLVALSLYPRFISYIRMGELRRWIPERRLIKLLRRPSAATSPSVGPRVYPGMKRPTFLQ